MPALVRPHPQKIKLGEMRDRWPSPAAGLLRRLQARPEISADPWPDYVRLPDLEAGSSVKACGKRGTDIRLLFDRERTIPDTRP
jgi:hypothetical protein